MFSYFSFLFLPELFSVLYCHVVLWKSAIRDVSSVMHKTIDFYREFYTNGSKAKLYSSLLTHEYVTLTLANPTRH